MGEFTEESDGWIANPQSSAQVPELTPGPRARRIPYGRRKRYVLRRSRCVKPVMAVGAEGMVAVPNNA